MRGDAHRPLALTVGRLDDGRERRRPCKRPGGLGDAGRGQPLALRELVGGDLGGRQVERVRQVELLGHLGGHPHRPVGAGRDQAARPRSRAFAARPRRPPTTWRRHRAQDWRRTPPCALPAPAPRRSRGAARGVRTVVSTPPQRAATSPSLGGLRGSTANGARGGGARPDRSRHRLAGAGGRRGGRGLDLPHPLDLARRRSLPEQARAARAAGRSRRPAARLSTCRAALVPGRRQGGRPSGPRPMSIVSHGDGLAEAAARGAARLARASSCTKSRARPGGDSERVRGNGRHHFAAGTARGPSTASPASPSATCSRPPGRAAAARTTDAAVAALGIRSGPTYTIDAVPDGRG